MSDKKREVQIKEAARQRADQYDHPSQWSDTYYGFIDGAHWADKHPQWIPVEKELPEERKVVWVRKHFNEEFLGEFDIYDSAAFCNGEFQCDNSGNVTHWMPIVPPQGNEE